MTINYVKCEFKKKRNSVTANRKKGVIPQAWVITTKVQDPEEMELNKSPITMLNLR